MANTLTNAQVNNFLASKGLAQVAGTGQAQGLITSGGFQKDFEQYQKNLGAIPGGTVNKSVAQTQNLPANFGSAPMTVEPLNQWQKEAMQAIANPGQLGGGGMTEAIAQLKALMANPQIAAANFTNPLATQYLTQAGGIANQAAAPITQSQVQEFANPFAQSLIDKLNESVGAREASVTANQGMRGAASFGDTVQGQRMGAIDRAQIQGEGDIRYKTFQDALTALQNQRGQQIQAAGTLGNLGTGAQNVTQSATGQALTGAGQLFNAGSNMTTQGFNTLKEKLNVGNQLQSYNQGVNNLIGNDILAQQGFEGNQITQLINMLKNYSGGDSRLVPSTNTLGTAGNIATIIAGLLKSQGGTPAGGTSTGNAANYNWNNNGFDWSVAT